MVIAFFIPYPPLACISLNDASGLRRYVCIASLPAKAILEQSKHSVTITGILIHVKKNNCVCQEQIELSGFVANELSAFSVHGEGSILNRKRAADLRIFNLDSRSYPQPLSRSPCRAWREGVVGNSVRPLFLSA
jgi:hypothetical protein